MKASASPRPSAGDYFLTPGLRRKLKKPLGRFFPSTDVRGEEFLALVTGASLVVAVGDRVTERIAELGRIPEVQVVDGRERRVERRMPDVPYSRLIRVRNPPGTITNEALDGIAQAVKERDGSVRVVVEGEEDLLAIAAVAAAPIGSNIYYGQPLVGVVLVRVDRAAKRRNGEILKEMGVQESG